MAFVLQDSQQVTVTIDQASIKDKKGKQTTLDGAPTWESSDPSILAVTPAADGLSAVVVAGDLGTAVVSATGDTRPGPDQNNITGTLDILVSAGEAVSFDLTPGTPEEQP